MNPPIRIMAVAAVAALLVGVALWKFKSNSAIESRIANTGLATAPSRSNPTAGIDVTSPANESSRLGDPRAAHIRIGATERTLVPNARGEFPRLVVAPAASISASVPFIDAAPGDRISLQTEDGGTLMGPAAGGSIAVDAGRYARLEYRAAATDGMQRVTLRRGGESRVLEFWIGAEPPVLARR